MDTKEYKKKHWEDQKKQGYRRVSVTLSGKEYDAVSRHAKLYNSTVTAHIKHLALAKLQDKYIVPENIEAKMDELVSILRGVGNNLNQLARYSNEMRYFLDTEEVRLNVKRMEESIKDFIRHPDQSEWLLKA